MITLIAEPSQVAMARRSFVDVAARAGLPETRSGDLAVIVTELATNLLKHAGCGEILLSCFRDQDGSGIEILSLDRGPGMKDVAACLRDGFSTAGSLGQGLGAISRRSDHLRIYSRPGLGTVASARLVVAPDASAAGVQCGAALMPNPGETVRGAAWAWTPTPAGATLLLVDGSGPGPEAGRAAEIGADVFRRHAGETLKDLALRLHHALMPTCGAAIALVRLDPPAGLARYLGIGTIHAGLLSAGQLVGMASQDGVAGHDAPRHGHSTYPCGSEALVILASAGLAARWDLSAYPGLTEAHPSLLAGVLLRDFRRGRGDASVVVMRITTPGTSRG